ncbi:hypothetical protein BHE74_00014910 [Ensete ventricosum]|nr:hypothetical protein BHE74_00014910 [Ensete ventricosum]
MQPHYPLFPSSSSFPNSNHRYWGHTNVVAALFLPPTSTTFPVVADPAVATSLNFFIFFRPCPSLLLSTTQPRPMLCHLLVAPNHALLYAALALGYDLRCHSRLPPLPLHLHRR